MSDGGIRDVLLGELPASLSHDEDGVMLVRSDTALGAVQERLTDRLTHWAEVTPEQVFLAERIAGGDWRKVTYAEAHRQVRRVASALLSRPVSPDNPIAILSGNDIDQAILSLAAMLIGIPVAPISPPYSLMSGDHGKLRDIVAKLTPGLVFASNAALFAKAIAAACDPAIEIVAGKGELSDRSVTPFSALAGTPESAGLAKAMAGVGPDTIAKILFTSGSTGQPKGVINTQRMLCSNQAMLKHWLAFGAEEAPVLVDWLPWHHTFGGNHNFNYVLHNGGSLYIDGGKPTPQGIAETARNLKEIAPTLYFNVPKGFEELVACLRQDEALRRNFFSRLKLTFYAGASLPPHIRHELDEIAVATTGNRILMVSSLGSTETAPAALACTRATALPGVVGVPLPGVELKLIPSAGKLEARLRGPTMTPGYWRDPEQSAKAFDEDGFYCLGDALKFATPGDPNGGFVFDGRVSEDFKLVTGTWVSVGPLRARLVSAFAPLARDAVIAGHDRNDVRALIVPEMEACRALLGASADGWTDAEVLAAPAIRSHFADRLKQIAADGGGSSMRVAGLVLLDEPPSLDANEITDKGSINQRAVLGRRAAVVEALYASPPPSGIIVAA